MRVVRAIPERDAMEAIERLGGEAEILWHGDETGFSGSASIPSALAEQLRKKVIKQGDVVLSLAVGAGLSSAAALYRV